MPKILLRVHDVTNFKNWADKKVLSQRLPFCDIGKS